jgi:glutathione peroxidase-family protein
MSTFKKTLISGTESAPLYQVLRSRIEGKREVTEKTIVDGNNKVIAGVSVTRPFIHHEKDVRS